MILACIYSKPVNTVCFPQTCLSSKSIPLCVCTYMHVSHTLKTFLLRPGLLPYPHPHVTGFLLLNLVCVCVLAHTHITMCTCISMYAYVVGGRLEARDPIGVVPQAPPMCLVRRVLLMEPRCSRTRLGWVGRKHPWSSCLSLPSSCRFSCLFVLFLWMLGMEFKPLHSHRQRVTSSVRILPHFCEFMLSHSQQGPQPQLLM